MPVDDFDFDLPEERIALRPVRPRDRARLLVVRPQVERQLHDSGFAELADWLSPGDALVLNDTRVIPALLRGRRLRAGGAEAAISISLDRPLGAGRWAVLARPAKRLRPGDRLRFGYDGGPCMAGQLEATVEARGEAGAATLAFDLAGPDLDAAIVALGDIPLPPYVASRRPVTADDRTDYQTVYCDHDGAVAAPTAGLHFSLGLLDRLVAGGISRHFVTLHVGAGTFLPVNADTIAGHRMHPERGHLGARTAEALNRVRARGGRIVAVGTTSLRLLESAADDTGRLAAFDGETDIFITPGYRFRAVDVLLTNFHLPRSTLFMLVAAFSGLETMQAAYAHAIADGYRFYSYGDACLLHPRSEAIHGR